MSFASRLLRPFALVLFLGAAVGCSADVEDEPPTQVSEARLTRIKEAFKSSKAEDFRPIEPVIDQATITGWNVDARDVQSYVFIVDDTNVYVVSFEADTKAVLEGAPPNAANPHESFLLFLDPTADTTALTSAALYREDTKEWVQAATRVTSETHPPPPSVDGGVPTLAPPIDAGPDSSLDGGPDASLDASTDGPTDAGVDAPTDAGADADGATDAKSDAPTDAATDAPKDSP